MSAVQRVRRRWLTASWGIRALAVWAAAVSVMIHVEDPVRFGASCLVAGMIAGDLFTIISGRAVGLSDLRFSAYLLFLNGLFVHEERWLSGILLMLGAAVFTAVGHDRQSSTVRDRRESAAAVAPQL